MPWDKIFTVKELARLLRDPPYAASYIRRLAIKHDLGRVIGRDRLFDEGDIGRFRVLLNQNR